MKEHRRELPCDGLVLSGGRGTRLGGLDKGLLPVRSRSAAEHALQRLKPLCTTVYLSANRHLDVYRELAGLQVLEDRRPGFRGPLAGLEAAAAQPLADLLLVLPVDLVLPDDRVPRTLLERIRAAPPELDIVYASDGLHDQYLCACLRSHCLDSLTARLDAGQHRVRGWLDSLNTERVLFEGADAAGLRNHNLPADWVSADLSALPR